MMKAFLVAIALVLVSSAHAQTEGGGNNTNTGVVPISREEAAKGLPPPIPVIDLSKAALVFNHPDELIRAAVADYLSTIKQPHDKFGNIISKNYKSATAPDKLDKKLVDHIVKFVGNRRHIALSPRQALGINQIQERQRQNDIDKIIYDDWAKRTREAFKNANAGGGGQGNTNAPSTNNGGGGGAGGGGGGNTNGGENVPNINQNNPPNTNGGGTNTNTPGSTEVSSRIEKEFGVTVEMTPKSWSAVELEGLEEVLKKLPRRYYQGVIFRRKDVILDGDKPEPRILGQASNTGQSSGTIEVSNSYNLEGNNGPKLDFPTPPYDKEQAKLLQYKATLAHEITHNFQFYGEGKRHANLSTDSQLVKNWASTFGFTFNSANGQWTLDPNRRDERVSNYGASSPMEDMSEAVAFYLYDPQRLKATDKDGRSRYNFVRDILGVAQQPNAAITLPTPKQRGLL